MFSVSQSVYYLRFPHIPSADFKYSRDWVKCELNVWDWVKGLLSLGWVCLFLTPWAVACQAPLSMGFLRRGYYSGLPCPSPGDLPEPGIKSTSPAMASGFFTTEPPGKPIELNIFQLSRYVQELQTDTKMDKQLCRLCPRIPLLNFTVHGTQHLKFISTAGYYQVSGLYSATWEKPNMNDNDETTWLLFYFF